MNAQLQPSPFGLYFDELAESYHVKRLGEVSNSAIKRLLRSPLHYKAWVEDTEEPTDTPALAFGRAFHAALLEPARFAAEWAIEPDFGDCRYKENKAARDAWKSVNVGKESLSSADGDRIAAMLAAVKAHPLAGRAIRDGRSEVTVRWEDESSGLPCKARADFYVDGKVPYVLDVKTCQDASPAEFARAIAKYGYHTQHAHYCEGFRVLGKPLSNYLLLAVESVAPYAVALYHLDPAAEIRGYELRQRAIDTLQTCIDSGQWPAYSNDITALSLPAWAIHD